MRIVSIAQLAAFSSTLIRGKGDEIASTATSTIAKKLCSKKAGLHNAHLIKAGLCPHRQTGVVFTFALPISALLAWILSPLGRR